MTNPLSHDQAMSAWKQNDPTDWLRSRSEDYNWEIQLELPADELFLKGEVYWSEVIGRFYYQLTHVGGNNFCYQFDEAFFSLEGYTAATESLMDTLGIFATKGIHSFGHDNYGEIELFQTINRATQ